MSKFKDFQDKLEREGHGADSAARIAAVAGDKKYGKADMEKAADRGEPAAKIANEHDKPCSNGIPFAFNNLRSKDDDGAIQVDESTLNRMAITAWYLQGLKR